MSDSLQPCGFATHQAPLSMGFSRLEKWSGLPFPSPGELPDPETKLMSPALAGGFFTAEPPEKCIWEYLLFTCSVMSSSLQPHGLQHNRLPCPSLCPLSLLKLMPIESVVPSNRLILCRPLLLLPSIFPSIRLFSSESALCIRQPKYWSFSFSISPFNYSGLISFRIDWFELLAVQGTLKSIFRH